MTSKERYREFKHYLAEENPVLLFVLRAYAH
jgi:hypothetical protein